ncbi:MULTISPECIES: dTDP-4-dehydrorhamnose 3,5-epimerase family protein [Pseudomonas]|uniref:dTDP-4-dehydrorhamnose 3,5-epimerase family protein n=1 Tax=Pseudomonas TaxID=286 RepID=UPI003530978B
MLYLSRRLNESNPSRNTRSTPARAKRIHFSANNKYQIWVPKGFAHGFVVLSDHAEFLYKTTAH